LKKYIPPTCEGVRRVPLAPEVREMARAVWPADHPRFWTRHDFFNHTNEPDHPPDYPPFKLGQHVWGGKVDVYSVNGAKVSPRLVPSRCSAVRKDRTASMRSSTACFLGETVVIEVVQGISPDGPADRIELAIYIIVGSPEVMTL
jgi:hypothetical protein